MRHECTISWVFMVLCIVLHAPLPARAETFQCRVTSVSDGDTVYIRDPISGERMRVRLEGIDAPELAQTGGRASRHALAQKVRGRDVRVVSSGEDLYGRLLGSIYLDDRAINKEMIREGWAWHYHHYSPSDELAGLEASARSEHLGIWNASAQVPPWRWREEHRGD